MLIIVFTCLTRVYIYCVYLPHKGIYILCLLASQGYIYIFSRPPVQCFFTSDSTMRKEKFMHQINFSHREGGLTCSFNDYQLAEFIQQRRRKAGRLTIKNAVEHVGLQADGTWVLGPSLFFSGQGTLCDPSQSKYAWVGNIYIGPGIADHSSACSIELPLSLNPLTELYLWVKNNMLHNFIPCMAMHYSTTFLPYSHCLWEVMWHWQDDCVSCWPKPNRSISLSICLAGHLCEICGHVFVQLPSSSHRRS